MGVQDPIDVESIGDRVEIDASRNRVDVECGREGVEVDAVSHESGEVQSVKRRTNEAGRLGTDDPFHLSGHRGARPAPSLGSRQQRAGPRVRNRRHPGGG